MVAGWAGPSHPGTVTPPSTALDSPGRIFADPGAYADPDQWHATAARLRREEPILRVSLPDYPEFWAITRHDHVMEIERNPEVFTNEPSPVLVPRAENRGQDAPMKTLVQMDGDEHRDHRALISDWFKPGNVKRLSDRVDALARRYVDEMAAMGSECDLARDVAMHFPLHVILSILGLPETDYPRMLQLTQELFGGDDPDIGRAGQDGSVVEVILDFMTYFTGLAADRRVHPGSDLASVIANARLDDAPLPDLDVFGFYLIIATAGHDTTSNAIAGGLLALIENPDERQRLVEQPDLIEGGADELIRYVSPVKHFIRTCQAPFRLGEVTFQPGDVTLLSYASANRDERVFPDPFRLDVTRPNASKHLAFGFGRHFCLGAHLARMEVRALFRELLGRLETVELAGSPTFVQSRLVSGPKTLPVRYRLH